MSKMYLNTYTKRFDSENRIALIYVEKQEDWKGTVEVALGKIIEQSFELKGKERTARTVLEIIASVWSDISKDPFPNLVTYYTVLAKMTDYLLSLLSEECLSDKHILVEKNTIASLDCTKRLKHFVYSIEENSIKSYMYKLINKISRITQAPNEIEIICIESGTKYSYFPYTKGFHRQGIIF